MVPESFIRPERQGINDRPNVELQTSKCWSIFFFSLHMWFSTKNARTAHLSWRFLGNWSEGAICYLSMDIFRNFKCFWCAARFGNLWLTPFPLTTQQMPSSVSFLASASWMKLNYSNFNILWTLSLGIIHIQRALKFESRLYADTHLSDLERHHFEPLLFLSTFGLFENRVIKNSVLGIVFLDKGISLVLFSAFLWMGPLLEISQEAEQCCSWESVDSRVRVLPFLSGLQVLDRW